MRHNQLGLRLVIGPCITIQCSDLRRRLNAALRIAHLTQRTNGS